MLHHCFVASQAGCSSDPRCLWAMGGKSHLAAALVSTFPRTSGENIKIQTNSSVLTLEHKKTGQKTRPVFGFGPKCQARWKLRLTESSMSEMSRSSVGYEWECVWCRCAVTYCCTQVRVTAILCVGVYLRIYECNNGGSVASLRHSDTLSLSSFMLYLAKLCVRMCPPTVPRPFILSLVWMSP